MTTTENPAIAARPGSRKRSPREPRPRRRLLVTLGILLALVAVFAAPGIWIQLNSAAHERSVAEVDDAPVALVFGAGLRAGGVPSPYLQRRLDAAAELYEQGSVEVILVSGDRRDDDYDEPAAMRARLLDLGVPDERIVVDESGYDTHDSCVRAKEAFGVDEAIVITQAYHIPRTVFLCEQAGISTQGIGVSSETAQRWKQTWYKAREFPAAWKAAWEGLTHRAPEDGTDPDPGVHDALESADRPN